MRFDIDLGKPTGRAAKRRAEQPLKVLVAGGFSGAPPIANDGPFTPHRLDLDNFDAVFSRLSPRLDLPGGGLGVARLKLEFNSLEDFHPDALFRSCGIFQALREQRARLADPASFAQTAAGMLEVAKQAAPLTSVEGDMFERLLGSRGRDSSVARPAAGAQAAAMQKLISSVVAPYIVPNVAPEQKRYLASVDAALTASMREVLHAPAFQALESAWRGVRALLDETEGSEDIQIWLLDASADRLHREIERHAEDPTRSALFDVLVGRAERAPDAEPWSIVVGDYLFGPGEADLHLLNMLGSLCRRAGATFIGGAQPQIAGCSSFATQADPGSWATNAADAERWNALRSQPHSSSVALTIPRMLNRLPYGRSFEAIDSFEFEELGDANHESLLWGNSAFVLGRLLVRGFLANGWDMQPGDELEVGDLPALVRGSGDDRKLQACAEVYLPERAAERLLSLGLVPLLSHEKRAAVRLMRVQSMAEPPAALSLT